MGSADLARSVQPATISHGAPRSYALALSWQALPRSVQWAYQRGNLIDREKNSSCSASYRSCFRGYPVKRRSTHKVASCVTSVVRAEDCALDLESTWKATHPLRHLTLVPPPCFKVSTGQSCAEAAQRWQDAVATVAAFRHPTPHSVHLLRLTMFLSLLLLLCRVVILIRVLHVHLRHELARDLAAQDPRRLGQRFPLRRETCRGAPLAALRDVVLDKKLEEQHKVDEEGDEEPAD